MEAPLLDSLEKELRRMTGVEVLRDDWNLDQLPEHLRITFRAVDHRNRKLKENRDLYELKESLKDKFKRRFLKLLMTISNNKVCTHGVLVNCRKCILKSVVGLMLKLIPRL